ncbi:MAG: HIT domain-containing protein [Candidatus Omnitrophica bacterium]|nr:HIT domain-containing protein [Candidatus Omnitrophota bacterium]
MKKIWAPWRSKFICAGRQKKACIFCRAAISKDHKKNLIVDSSRYSFSMLNLYPYNNGHMMVAPKSHKPGLEQLSPAELTDIMGLLKKTIALLRKTLFPEGFNIGINTGKAAGAGFPGHLHIHVVPRWTGDTNFMPVSSDTKVISESLEALYCRLRKNVKKS